jgi:hypothetical protein
LSASKGKNLFLVPIFRVHFLINKFQFLFTSCHFFAIFPSGFCFCRCFR